MEISAEYSFYSIYVKHIAAVLKATSLKVLKARDVSILFQLSIAANVDFKSSTSTRPESRRCYQSTQPQRAPFVVEIENSAE